MPKSFKLVSTTFNLRRGALSPEVKIVIIGQASVGKTAMILQYITGDFIEDYTPQCATLYDHSVKMDNATVGIRIWDTAGQFEMETNLRQLEVFIRWADVILMTYAVTDPASFILASHLLEEIQKCRPLCDRFSQCQNGKTTSSKGGDKIKKCCESCPDLPVLVVATKVDLIHKRKVSEESGISLSQRAGCISYREVSAKNIPDFGKGVPAIFEEAVRRGWLYKQHCVLSRNKYLALSQNISQNSGVSIQVSDTLNVPSSSEGKQKAEQDEEERCNKKSIADWFRKLAIKPSDNKPDENEETPRKSESSKEKFRRASLVSFRSDHEGVKNPKRKTSVFLANI